METQNNTVGEGGDVLDSLFDCLANADRRHLLGGVYDRSPTAVTLAELATSLAARNRGKPRDQVAREGRQQALAALHHVHLPKLDDAGLVEAAGGGDAVALADHPAFRDPGVVEAIDGDGPADPRSRDALFAALADAHRRAVLDVLSHQYQSIQTETLAREVVARERDVAERDVPTEAVDRTLVSLRHVQLPQLRDAGLVEYDADEGTVAYEGHPSLRVPWMHSELGTEFRATLTDTPTDAEIWNLEGRERIISCGQSLCDAADDELFLMFTTTGLLEAGCFARIAQAADRGVDVYLGTCDPTVREFVRENVPAVTLWEPETNWLDLPVDEENVGRLVFADREAIMIGTLGEKTDEGVHEERAIVGEGTDNTLVVLMRQMLGSRLDEFDERDQRIDSQLSL